MTTTTDRTVTLQARAAAALVAILAKPGLPEANWHLHREDLGAVLDGQLRESPAGDARAAVDTYAVALGLTPQKDEPMGHGPGGFTHVSARGEFMGATVEIWCAADKGGRR
jgi:hypothetical protein